MNKENFYKERDKRTESYGIGDTICEKVICISIGQDAAETYRGQMMFLTFINLLARLHRNIRIDVPDVKLVFSSSVLGATTGGCLKETSFRLAQRVAPFINMSTDLSAGSAGIGIGKFSKKMPWYVGCDGDIVTLDRAPLTFDARSGPSLGAGLAACLAAATLFKQVTGQAIQQSRDSIYSMKPGELVTGKDPLPPLDIGDVMIVGAGGVGCCFIYWLSFFEKKGNWYVVDGDKIELHNTNRTLGFFPDQCETVTGVALNKANIGSDIIGAEPIPVFYHLLPPKYSNVDLILPLANEHDVREAISQRGDPIILHSTTSDNWEAQTHRHIPDHDDCLVCRMPKTKSMRFHCSTVKIASKRGSTDAALPFLSAAAGLMLLTNLFRLMDGSLITDPCNIWRINFLSRRTLFNPGISPVCRCHNIVPKEIRKKGHQNSRWAKVDQL